MMGPTNPSPEKLPRQSPTAFLASRGDELGLARSAERVISEPERRSFEIGSRVTP